MLLTWKDFTGEQLCDEWSLGIVFTFLLVPSFAFVSYMASKLVVCYCCISISDIQNIYDEEESDEEEHGKIHDKTSP